MEHTSQLWRKESYVKRYNEVYPLPTQDMEYYTSFLTKDSFVLDLGCGNASYLRYLREVFLSEGRLVGLDMSPFQEHSEIEESLGIERIQKDFRDFAKEPYKNPSGQPIHNVDFILARASLHHIPLKDKKTFFSLLRENHIINEKKCDFVLHDVIFDFPRSEVSSRLTQLISEAEQYYGLEKFNLKRQDIIDTWLKEEPESLEDWCEAISLAGFKLRSKKKMTSFLHILHFSI